MSDQNGNILDLRALEGEVAGRIQLRDGVHDVLALNADQYQQLATMDESNSVERLYDVAAACVPTLGADRVRTQGIKFAKAITVLAGQGIDAVQAMFPNANGPENESSTSPGSSPETA